MTRPRDPAHPRDPKSQRYVQKPRQVAPPIQLIDPEWCDCGHSRWDHLDDGVCVHEDQVGNYDCHCDSHSPQSGPATPAGQPMCVCGHGQSNHWDGPCRHEDATGVGDCGCAGFRHSGQSTGWLEDRPDHASVIEEREDAGADAYLRQMWFR